jgi:hypothetical protein
VNYVAARERFDLLVGFRYVSLDEEFNINSTDSDSGTSDYNIRTSNDLYGGQLGARVRAYRCGWDWEATAKGGVFGNSAEQRQLVTDFPPTSLLRPTISDSTSTVAFVGDVNLSAVYQWTEAWAIRGGYNLLWIEGVALAPDQLDFTTDLDSGSDLQTGGSLFAHGFNVGLESRW